MKTPSDTTASNVVRHRQQNVSSNPTDESGDKKEDIDNNKKTDSTTTNQDTTPCFKYVYLLWTLNIILIFSGFVFYLYILFFYPTPRAHCMMMYPNRCITPLHCDPEQNCALTQWATDPMDHADAQW